MTQKPIARRQSSKLRAQRPEVRGQRAAWRSAIRLSSVLCPLTSALLSAHAQDALRLSLSNESAAAQRRLGLENIPYTVRWGDLKLLTSASLAGDWNDNINLANSNPQQDFIFTPMARLDAFWPVTDVNLLTFSMGAGYEKFLRYDQYDQALITPDSALGWDVFIKDWHINFHDQFSYSQEATTWGAISGVARMGGLNNTAGVLASWDLHDVVLSFGYDHFNFVSATSTYDYLSRASDFGLARAAFKVHPAATVGLELSGGPTAYDEKLLSDNTTYSAGVFADWQLTPQIKLQPRGGYYLYSFSEQNSSGGASDQTGYYFSLNLTHRPSERVSYGLEGGRQAFMGNNSALTEQWYGSVWADWRIIEHITLTTGFRYEAATQPITFQFSDNYTRDYADIKLSCPIKQKLTASLEYRYWLKTDEHFNIFDYEQNRLTLQLAYHF